MIRAARSSSGSCAGASLVIALLSTGCYTYQAPPAGPPGPGSEVRALLSSEGMVRMEAVFGEPRREVEGELLETNASRLLLLARTEHSSGPAGSTREPLRQRVVLNPAEVLHLAERRLDMGRTLGASVSALVVGGYLLYRAFTFGRDGDTFGLPPGGPDMFRPDPP